VGALNSIWREVAVRAVASQQLEAARTINISGIAASTGIPRAEISKILKGQRPSSSQRASRHIAPTNRILNAWGSDPRFLVSNGLPAELKIYGRGATFDALVKSHGAGIPTRAMFDELVRAKAIELRSSHVARLKTSVADNRMTPQLIKTFGNNALFLLCAAIQSIYKPETLAIMEKSRGRDTSANPHLTQKQVSSRGSRLAADIERMLLGRLTKKDSVCRSDEKSRVVISIAVSGKSASRKRPPIPKRKNLRRVH
jgi:Family of unknown function (DUF6502)